KLEPFATPAEATTYSLLRATLQNHLTQGLGYEDALSVTLAVLAKFQATTLHASAQGHAIDPGPWVQATLRELKQLVRDRDPKPGLLGPASEPAGNAALAGFNLALLAHLRDAHGELGLSDAGAEAILLHLTADVLTAYARRTLHLSWTQMETVYAALGKLLAQKVARPR